MLNRLYKLGAFIVLLVVCPAMGKGATTVTGTITDAAGNLLAG